MVCVTGVVGVISGALLFALPVLGATAIPGLGSVLPDAPAAALGGTAALCRAPPSDADWAQAHSAIAATMLIDVP